MNPPAQPQSRFTVDRIVRFLVTAAILVLVGWLLWYFSDLVFYLILSVLLAYILNPLVGWFQSSGLGRVPAILLTFLTVFFGIGILVASLIPFISRQVVDLSALLSIDSVQNIAANIEAWLAQYFAIPPGTIIEAFSQTFATLFHGEGITRTLSQALDIFANIFYAVVIVPFVTFFFLKDGIFIREWLFSFIPNRYFEMSLNVVEKVESIVGRYFGGLMIQCLSVATVATILLSIVGLRNALVVGLFTGIANTIPYFGPFFGFVAGAIVGIAQTGDFSLVLGVLIAMALTQLSDNIFFQPFIFSRVARMHPLVILFVVLIGARLAGIIGMLIAIPVSTIIYVAVGQVLWSLRNYQVFRAAP